jgi:hypothetical protein
MRGRQQKMHESEKKFCGKDLAGNADKDGLKSKIVG